MERAAALLAAVKAFVGNPQFPVIAATAILVTAGVLWGRRWYLARTNGHAGGIVADAFAVVAPYLVGLVILGLALFAAGGEPRPWYETAATLLALLALIRLAMFLLRLSLGKSRTIKTWELRATLIVWARDRRRGARLARPGDRRSSTRSGSPRARHGSRSGPC